MVAFTLLLFGIMGADAFTVKRIMSPRRVLRVAKAENGLETETSLENGATVQQVIASCDPALQATILSLFKASKDIASQVKKASCDRYSCFASLGDDEEAVAVDLLAEQYITDALRATGAVESISSAEEGIISSMSGKGFSVAYDPLDGSSIMDTNFPVGTIAGVWKGSKLLGVRGRDMAAAVTTTYGPRTTISLAIAGIEGAHNFLLLDEAEGETGKWVKGATYTTLGPGRLFAPSNLKAANDNSGFRKLIDFYISEDYSLRMVGSLVADVNQILVKGYGCFAHAASENHPPTLRALYESVPLSFIVEKAGGRSSDGEASVLDHTISTTNDRVQFACGSDVEVERFESMVGPESDGW